MLGRAPMNTPFWMSTKYPEN